MKRAFKWILPALILIEVALVWFEILDFGEAVIVVTGIEALIFLTGVGGPILMVRRYRRNRSSGLDFWTALEDGLAVLLPRPIARLAVAEPRMFYCLVKWALRKAKLRDGEFSYHKRSTLDMLVLLVVLVTPVEVLVVELLLQAFLPWLWMRLLVLLLEVYALFWFLGFHASRIALPHRLEEKGLRLRHGVFAEGFIPYSVIGYVERARKEAPRPGDGLTVDGEEAFLAIGGHTNVTIGLHSPLSLRGFFEPTEPVGAVHLAADEAERFVERLKEPVAATPIARWTGSGVL